MNKKNIFDMFSLRGKIVIITGGNGMLGSEYTKTLTDAGAKVYSFDINKGKSSVDITNKEEVEKAVKSIINKHGKIDILINNAAMTDFSGFKDTNRFAPYEDFSLSVWDKEINVGLTGGLICAQAVIPYMKKEKSGTIINVSSTHGLIAPDNRMYGKGKYKAITYPVIKSGIIGFTRALASYLGEYNIRVNTLVPGGVKAGYLDKKFEDDYGFRTMLGRMANKNDYNSAILFLCSDSSSYMTGSSLVVDGGWTAW